MKHSKENIVKLLETLEKAENDKANKLYVDGFNTMGYQHTGKAQALKDVIRILTDKDFFIDYCEALGVQPTE